MSQGLRGFERRITSKDRVGWRVCQRGAKVWALPEIRRGKGDNAFAEWEQESGRRRGRLIPLDGWRGGGDGRLGTT